MKIYLIFNILLVGFGCNQSASNTAIPVTEENNCKKIVAIADAYNPYERKHWLPYNTGAKSNYPLDDSLNVICKRLSLDFLQKDSSCRNTFIFLCEKFYLSVYRASNGNRNSFSVYNAAVWDTDLFWLNYCLNVLIGKKKEADKTIEQYAQTTSDWIFVEHIIAEGERNKSKINNDIFLKVHDSCIAIYPKVRDSLAIYPSLNRN